MNSPGQTTPTPRKHTSRSRIIAANSFWMALDTALSFAGGLVASVAVARILGPAKLGYYSYVLWLALMTVALGNVGVPTATRKYLAEAIGSGSVSLGKAIVRATYRFQFFSASVVVVFGLIVVFLKVPGEHRVFAILAVLSMAPNMLLSIASAANFAMENLAANVMPSLVGTVLNLTGVALTLVFGWELVGLAASMLISRTGDCVVRHAAFRRIFRREFGEVPDERLSREMKARLWRFCSQASVLQIFHLVIWDRSEMLFLKEFCSIPEVAFYSTAFNISSYVLVLPQVFLSSVAATLMVRLSEDRRAATAMAATAMRYGFLVAVPLGLGLAAMSGPAIRLLYGKQYVPAIPALAVLAFFSSAKVLLLPSRMLLIADDRQDVMVRWTIVIAGVNLLLDFLLIPHFASLGAAIANSASQTIAAVGISYSACRLLPMRVESGLLLRIFLPALFMMAVAGSIALLLPPLPAALIGVPAGAVSFLVLLRAARALTGADYDRLLHLSGRLPGPARRLVQVGLRLAIAR